MGAVANLLALGGAAEDYARWGYPRRFNFVPGSLELATALLLLRGRTRVWGAVLGALIMACAGATVLLNGEHTHCQHDRGRQHRWIRSGGSSTMNERSPRIAAIAFLRSRHTPPGGAIR